MPFCVYLRCPCVKEFSKKKKIYVQSVLRIYIEVTKSRIMYGLCVQGCWGGGGRVVRKYCVQCVCLCKESPCTESGVGAVATWAEGISLFSYTTVHKIDGSFDTL